MASNSLGESATRRRKEQGAVESYGLNASSPFPTFKADDFFATSA